MDRFRYWLQTQPRSKPYSPRSIQAYVDQVSLFIRWLADNQLDAMTMTTEDVLDHLADMAGVGYAPASISLRHIAVRIYLDHLGRKPNPAKDIPVRRGQMRPGEPYTPNEVARMYHACRDYRERAVFLILLGTGLRKGEVFGISRDDCNFAAGTIRVLGKGDQYRFVQAEPFVMDALITALEFSDRLCPQKHSEYVYRLVKELGKRAGVPGRHHPHRLRHTFAVQWCEAGGPESELQLILGHSSSRMTAYYSRVGRERRALRTMGTLAIASRLLGPGVV